MAVQFQVRRGTAATWTAANTLLAAGEIGLETDTKKFKMGDGTSAWNVLPYAPASIDTSSGLRAFGDLVERHGVSKMIVYGHSLAYGGGASDPDRDVTTHLASMLKMREVPRAQGGAILHWDQGGTTGDGGYAHVLQNEIRKTRGSSTLNGNTSIGATTMVVTDGTQFKANDLIFVGIGAAGATGGECLWVSAVAVNTLTVQNVGGSGGAARAHLTGEPIYVVPAAYININPLYIVWYGMNDLAAAPITSGTQALKDRFYNPWRMVLSRCRCAEVYEDTHKSCVYTGSWTLGVALTSANSGTSVAQPTAVNAAVTIHTPDNFLGGVVVMGFVNSPAFGVFPTWTFTVDGVAAGSVTGVTGYPGKNNAICKRFTGLSAGRHTIVATLTTAPTVGFTNFDWWGIEAQEPPIILVPSANRVYAYTLWPSWNNSRRTSTLNAGFGPGTTAFTCNALSTTPQVGATVTFEEGLGNAETLEIAAAPAPTTTTFSTTVASTKTHANTSAITVGMQDADCAKMNTEIQSVVAEFDNRVVYVDIDALINKDPNYFYLDGAHYNDRGHASLAKTFADALALAPGFNAQGLSYTAAPSAPLPDNVVLFSPGAGPQGPEVSRTEIAAGTVLYTTPSGIGAIFVECVGPGAGGGGTSQTAANSAAGAGGGGGGYASKWISNPAATYPCVVGAGGAGGAATGANGAGGSAATTFGTGPLVSAGAGAAGANGMVFGTTLVFSQSGSPGAGTIGDRLLTGGPGGNGTRLSGTQASSGCGGDSAAGAGGGSPVKNEQAGVNGTIPGGGGSGGTCLGTTARAGGNGADGRIYVTEYAYPGAWFQMPAALTEFQGNTVNRKRLDFRRAFEIRFIVQVKAAGFAGSGIRLQYSVDNGATWRYIDRTALYADGLGLEALLTSTGEKDSGWSPLPAEAIADNVYVRVVGINGNAVVTPVFGNIDLYVR